MNMATKSCFEVAAPGMQVRAESDFREVGSSFLHFTGFFSSAASWDAAPSGAPMSKSASSGGSNISSGAGNMPSSEGGSTSCGGWDMPPWDKASNSCASRCSSSLLH